LPAGTRVAIDHLGTDGDDSPKAYRLSFDGSEEELRLTVQGDVVLKPLDSPAAALHLEYPESLVLYPRSGSLDLDVLFDRFAGDEITHEIPIDRLALLRIVEQHGTKQFMVREDATLLGGNVQLQATGARHPLKKGESLRFAGLTGALTGMRLGEDGIRCVFQGRVSKLERAAEGLQPENLMPSVLDLWITGPAQRAVQAATGVLAVLILLLTVLYPWPNEKEIS